MPLTYMSAQTRRIIGFDYCLSQLRPASAYGQACKQALKPCLPGQEDALEKEFDSLENLLSLLRSSEGQGALDSIHHDLTQIPDWREPLGRVSAGGVLSDVELFGLKKTLYFLLSIAKELRPLEVLGSSPIPPLPVESLLVLSQMLDPENSGSPAFYISDRYSDTLATIREEVRALQRLLRSAREVQVSKVTADLGVVFNPAGEIPIPRLDSDLRRRIEASGLFLLSRETYTDTYFDLKLSPQELDLRSKLEAAHIAEDAEEESVREKLSQAVRSEAEELHQTFVSLGYLDFVLAKAKLARQWGCSRPRLHRDATNLTLEFTDARHPKVEAELLQQQRPFAPISLKLGQGLAVITGANMGGKTVTLRTIGLLAALAAHGLFIPVTELTLTLFNHIAILAGDYDVNVTGLSRFGQEVAGLNIMLPQKDNQSLLLFDELAASTNPTEGSALAIAVSEYLMDSRSIAVLTTHYDLSARLAGVDHWQVKGLSQVSQASLEEALSENSSASLGHLSDLMDFSLQQVTAQSSHPREAIRVASYLNLPTEIIQRATQLTENKHPPV